VEMVTVVTPTRGKTRDWHPLLYACFKHQDYEPKLLSPRTLPRIDRYAQPIVDRIPQACCPRFAVPTAPPQ
jgi:hypothetical protein